MSNDDFKNDDHIDDPVFESYQFDNLIEYEKKLSTLRKIRGTSSNVAVTEKEPENRDQIEEPPPQEDSFQFDNSEKKSTKTDEEILFDDYSEIDESDEDYSEIEEPGDDFWVVEETVSFEDDESEFSSILDLYEDENYKTKIIEDEFGEEETALPEEEYEDHLFDEEDDKKIIIDELEEKDIKHKKNDTEEPGQVELSKESDWNQEEIYEEKFYEEVDYEQLIENEYDKIKTYNEQTVYIDDTILESDKESPLKKYFSKEKFSFKKNPIFSKKREETEREKIQKRLAKSEELPVVSKDTTIEEIVGDVTEPETIIPPEEILEENEKNHNIIEEGSKELNTRNEIKKLKKHDKKIFNEMFYAEEQANEFFNIVSDEIKKIDSEITLDDYEIGKDNVAPPSTSKQIEQPEEKEPLIIVEERKPSVIDKKDIIDNEFDVLYETIDEPEKIEKEKSEIIEEKDEPVIPEKSETKTDEIYNITDQFYVEELEIEDTGKKDIRVLEDKKLKISSKHKDDLFLLNDVEMPIPEKEKDEVNVDSSEEEKIQKEEVGVIAPDQEISFEDDEDIEIYITEEKNVVKEDVEPELEFKETDEIIESQEEILEIPEKSKTEIDEIDSIIDQFYVEEFEIKDTGKKDIRVLEEKTSKTSSMQKDDLFLLSDIEMPIPEKKESEVTVDSSEEEEIQKGEVGEIVPDQEISYKDDEDIEKLEDISPIEEKSEIKEETPKILSTDKYKLHEKEVFEVPLEEDEIDSIVDDIDYEYWDEENVEEIEEEIIAETDFSFEEELVDQSFEDFTSIDELVESKETTREIKTEDEYDKQKLIDESKVKQKILQSEELITSDMDTIEDIDSIDYSEGMVIEDDVESQEPDEMISSDDDIFEDVDQMPFDDEVVIEEKEEVEITTDDYMIDDIDRISIEGDVIVEEPEEEACKEISPVLVGEQEIKVEDLDQIDGSEKKYIVEKIYIEDKKKIIEKPKLIQLGDVAVPFIPKKIGIIEEEKPSPVFELDEVVVPFEPEEEGVIVEKKSVKFMELDDVGIPFSAEELGITKKEKPSKLFHFDDVGIPMTHRELGISEKKEEIPGIFKHEEIKSKKKKEKIEEFFKNDLSEFMTHEDVEEPSFKDKFKVEKQEEIPKIFEQEEQELKSKKKKIRREERPFENDLSKFMTYEEVQEPSKLFEMDDLSEKLSTKQNEKIQKNEESLIFPEKHSYIEKKKPSKLYELDDIAIPFTEDELGIAQYKKPVHIKQYEENELDKSVLSNIMKSEDSFPKEKQETATGYYYKQKRFEEEAISENLLSKFMQPESPAIKSDDTFSKEKLIRQKNIKLDDLKDKYSISNLMNSRDKSDEKLLVDDNASIQNKKKFINYYDIDENLLAKLMDPGDLKIEIVEPDNLFQLEDIIFSAPVQKNEFEKRRELFDQKPKSVIPKEFVQKDMIKKEIVTNEEPKEIPEDGLISLSDIVNKKEKPVVDAPFKQDDISIDEIIGQDEKKSEELSYDFQADNLEDIKIDLVDEKNKQKKRGGIEDVEIVSLSDIIFKQENQKKVGDKKSIIKPVDIIKDIQLEPIEKKEIPIQKYEKNLPEKENKPKEKILKKIDVKLEDIDIQLIEEEFETIPIIPEDDFDIISVEAVEDFIDENIKPQDIIISAAKPPKEEFEKIEIDNNKIEIKVDEDEPELVNVSDIVGKREKPLYEKPIAETPVVKIPVAEIPVAKTPVAKTPVEKTPVEKTPVEKTPVTEETEGLGDIFNPKIQPIVIAPREPETESIGDIFNQEKKQFGETLEKIKEKGISKAIYFDEPETGSLADIFNPTKKPIEKISREPETESIGDIFNQEKKQLDEDLQKLKNKSKIIYYDEAATGSLADIFNPTQKPVEKVFPEPETESIGDIFNQEKKNEKVVSKDEEFPDLSDLIKVRDKKDFQQAPGIVIKDENVIDEIEKDEIVKDEIIEKEKEEELENELVSLSDIIGKKDKQEKDFPSKVKEDDLEDIDLEITDKPIDTPTVKDEDDIEILTLSDILGEDKKHSKKDIRKEKKPEIAELEDIEIDSSSDKHKYEWKRIDDDEIVSLKDVLDERKKQKEEVVDDEFSDKVNILREKTFNKELKQLVDDITDGEKIHKGQDTKKSSNDEIYFEEIPSRGQSLINEKKDILLQLHELYYKTLNLYDYKKIDKEFDPYNNELEFYETLSIEEIGDVLHNKLINVNYPHFALLNYNIEKKCYTPSINRIIDIDTENIVLGINDKLYHNILNDKYGVLLKERDIKEDKFLMKKFGNDRAITPIYFVSIQKLLNDSIDFLDIGVKKELSRFHPHIILMLQLKEDTPVINKITLYTLLKNKMSHLLYRLNDYFMLKFSNIDYTDLDSIYNYFEYLLSTFSQYKNGVGTIVNVKNLENEEIDYVLKYMIAKIRSSLGPEAAIIHITKYKIIILTTKENIENVYELLNYINSHYGGALKYSTFDTVESSRYENIFKKII